MKKHSLLKTLLIIILIIMIASWFIPITEVTDGAFTESNSASIGLFNIADYFSESIQLFCNVSIFVLVVGGFYGVLHKIPQYRVLLDKIVDGFAGREWIFMIVIGVIFSLLTAMAGISVPLLFMFPFVISVILLMGYDKMTAALLTVGSVISGLIGTVFCNSGLVGSGFTYASLTTVPNIFEQFGVEGGSFGAADNFAFKIVLLVLSLSIVLINTILYARKHQDKKHLVKGYFIPDEVVVDGKQKIMPIAIIFDVTLLVLTLSFISWNLFGITFFEDITKNFINPRSGDFINGLYGSINTILGVSIDNVFGAWNLVQAALTVLLASYLISFIYKKTFNSYLTDFVEGVKKAFMPALLICISFTIMIMAVESPMQLTILKGILDLDSGISVIPMVLVALLYCLFIVDPFFGVAQAASYIGTVVAANTIGLTALIWQTMYGIAMFVSPVSIILLATLSYLEISYTSWLKSIWKILLELMFVVLIIMFVF